MIFIGGPAHGAEYTVDDPRMPVRVATPQGTVTYRPVTLAVGGMGHRAVMTCNRLTPPPELLEELKGILLERWFLGTEEDRP